MVSMAPSAAIPSFYQQTPLTHVGTLAKRARRAGGAMGKTRRNPLINWHISRVYFLLKYLTMMVLTTVTAAVPMLQAQALALRAHDERKPAGRVMGTRTRKPRWIQVYASWVLLVSSSVATTATTTTTTPSVTLTSSDRSPYPCISRMRPQPWPPPRPWAPPWYLPNCCQFRGWSCETVCAPQLYCPSSTAVLVATSLRRIEAPFRIEAPPLKMQDPGHSDLCEVGSKFAVKDPHTPASLEFNWALLLVNCRRVAMPVTRQSKAKTLMILGSS